jgi:Tol biopolymer transport system component/C-terminal processing protease CtpA/Prc
MHRYGIARWLLASAFAGLACTQAATAERVTFARHLALSPDGATLAFTWAGDIWTVADGGGQARRLTVHPARDSRPVWSHDGRSIAFASARHGVSNVFTMTAAGGTVTRLTYGDRPETPTGWTADDQAVIYDARKTGEVTWLPRIYTVPVSGGQSFRMMEASGSDATFSPDGQHLAFARGASMWWRTDYRGSANWDIWVRDTRSGDIRQVTKFDGTDSNPAWNRTGSGVYFLADRVGPHNVWYQPLSGGDGGARRITDVSGHRVRDFTIAPDESVLVYTQWDKVYAMDLPGGRVREIEILAAADSPANAVELKTYTKDADEIEVSPDGKEIALVVRGEIYVIQTEKGKPTRRVTDSPARDWQVTWSPDGKALFFVSDREGQEDVFRATSAEKPQKALCDSLRFKIQRVTDDPETETRPHVSPDGKSLSFLRTRGDLVVRDLAGGEQRVLFEGWNQPAVRWSPDSKWIAYEVEDEEYNPDVWIIPADGSAPPVNISQHPDADGSPQWSADGQVLAFTSTRRGFDSDLYMVFLSSELHQKSSVELAEYFNKAGETVKKRKPLKSCAASKKIALGAKKQDAPATAESPAAKSDADEEDDADESQSIETRLRSLLKEFLEEPDKDAAKDKAKDKQKGPEYEYDLTTAFERIRLVTSLPSDQSQFALAPSGETIAFASSHEGERALFTVKWNGEDRKRILTSGVGALQWTFDGKRIVYLKGGVPGSCSDSGGDAKSHAFGAKMAIDHRAEAQQKFNDAARRMGLWFYHPTLKNLDWPTLTAEYRHLALSTHTVEEFNEIFNLLQGRLNGSHMGISAPGRSTVEPIGYLGCDFDKSYPGPGLRISEITPDSPADRGESKLHVGDVILRINDEIVGPTAAAERALIDKNGQQVIVEYIPTEREVDAGALADAASESADEAGNDDNSPKGKLDTKELVIRPISYGAYSNLQYDAWVEANRKYVDENSGGRVGYAHILGMGESQFHAFERDLYAAAHGREGLIVDVRNNGGGWTADWVMAVLNVRRHAYTIGRGGQRGYPQGRLIFYAWDKPATMMCNQFSYSNAEIVSHAFKNLARGPLVGTPTFGAVISTGSYGLMDGARIRQPFRGWYTLPDGVDMELHGAMPTVPVDRTPADEQAGRFPQLDAAIKATLAQLGGGQAAAGAP